MHVGECHSGRASKRHRRRGTPSDPRQTHTRWFRAKKKERSRQRRAHRHRPRPCHTSCHQAGLSSGTPRHRGHRARGTSWEACASLPGMVRKPYTPSNPNNSRFCFGQAFWFSAPHLGAYCSNLMNGRTELTTLLRRTKRKEILMRELTKKVLRRTVMELIRLAWLCLPWRCSHLLAHLVNGAHKPELRATIARP